MLHEVLHPKSWKATPGYSNGIAATGRMVFTGGVIGWNDQQEFETDDFGEQVGIALQSIVAILAEAGLSYVGLGAQPPTPSWGRMLAEAQTMVTLAPHVAIVPGVAIVLTVLGLNLLGDALRDALDPRLKARLA